MESSPDTQQYLHKFKEMNQNAQFAYLVTYVAKMEKHMAAMEIALTGLYERIDQFLETQGAVPGKNRGP
jgi:hypothetical protein